MFSAARAGFDCVENFNLLQKFQKFVFFFTNNLFRRGARHYRILSACIGRQALLTMSRIGSLVALLLACTAYAQSPTWCVLGPDWIAYSSNDAASPNLSFDCRHTTPFRLGIIPTPGKTASVDLIVLDDSAKIDRTIGTIPLSEAELTHTDSFRCIKSFCT